MRQTAASMALSRIMASGATPISDLDKLLAQMTMTITDTAAAAELQEMAIAALLPPGLRALAEELGLFGLRVKEVAGIVEDTLPETARLESLIPAATAFDTRSEQALIRGELLPKGGQRMRESQGATARMQSRNSSGSI